MDFESAISDMACAELFLASALQSAQPASIMRWYGQDNGALSLSPEKRAAQDLARKWARDSAESTYQIYYLQRRIKLNGFRF
jgi:hypothetical protein